MSYRSNITQDKSQLEAEQVEFTVEDGKQSIDADILATKKDINIVKGEIAKAKRAIPFDSSAVLKQIVKKEGLEKGLKLLEDLKEELSSQKLKLKKQNPNH